MRSHGGSLGLVLLTCWFMSALSCLNCSQPSSSSHEVQEDQPFQARYKVTVVKWAEGTSYTSALLSAATSAPWGLSNIKSLQGFGGAVHQVVRWTVNLSHRRYACKKTEKLGGKLVSHPRDYLQRGGDSSYLKVVQVVGKAWRMNLEQALQNHRMVEVGRDLRRSCGPTHVLR